MLKTLSLYAGQLINRAKKNFNDDLLALKLFPLQTACMEKREQKIKISNQSGKKKKKKNVNKQDVKNIYMTIIK